MEYFQIKSNSTLTSSPSTENTVVSTKGNIEEF